MPEILRKSESLYSFKNHLDVKLIFIVAYDKHSFSMIFSTFLFFFYIVFKIYCL